MSKILQVFAEKTANMSPETVPDAVEGKGVVNAKQKKIVSVMA